MRGSGKKTENVIYGEAGRVGSLLCSCEETLLLGLDRGTDSPRGTVNLSTG